MCARVLQQHGIAVAVYEADTAVDSRDAGGTLDLHADSGQIALEDAQLMGANAALAHFFAVGGPNSANAPFSAPDHQAEHERYRAAPADYRRQQDELQHEGN